MSYPTLPFALVYMLAQVTPERATLKKGGRHVGIYVHKDKSINSIRLDIQSDEQLPQIEAEVARLIAQGPCDTITLTFSATDADASDLGVIIEKGKPPMIFTWEWSPRFGITLNENEETRKQIDTWSGVKLARDLMNRNV